MTTEFKINIPTENGETFSHTLTEGDILFVLGANGTGKSSLMTYLNHQHSNQTKKLAAHRQTWFENNAPSITANEKDRIDNNIKNNDNKSESRYRLYEPTKRIEVLLLNLINLEIKKDINIATLFKNDKIKEATEAKNQPSLIDTINRLFRISNIDVKLEIKNNYRIVARIKDEGTYSISQLSDGERSAFLIASEVLTAKKGTLFLIDEPERHLHRSIISIFLTNLFKERKDCAFIVATHEVKMPLDSLTSKTLLLRSCTFKEHNPTSWTVNLLDSNDYIDEDIKRDILGARQDILFVEGNENSLDLPLYNILFPNITILPKGSCHEVEQSVKGLKNSKSLHWINCCGIVDKDLRSESELKHLRDNNIFALPCYSVESIYYHPTMLSLAEKHSKSIGEDHNKLMADAKKSAINAISKARDHLVGRVVRNCARDKIISLLPNKKTPINAPSIKIDIPIDKLKEEEQNKFDSLIESQDYEELISRYPIRESYALNCIVNKLKIADRSTYEKAIINNLEQDEEALSSARDLLGDLYIKLCHPEKN